MILPAGALEPDPEQARDWLREELVNARYQESPGERLLRWIDQLLSGLQDAAASAGGFNLVLALALAVVLVVLLALGLSRMRRETGGEVGSAPVFDDRHLSAAGHRAAAEAAYAEERWDDVVLDAVRALSAGLVERGLLAETRGLTARETTATATGRFPALADGLARLRDAFDATRYGARHADRETADLALQIEHATRTGTPTAGTASGPVSAVPS